MKTFEVLLNGKKLCTAGVGDHGVLTAIVSSRDCERGKGETRLEVGGYVESTGEHIRWQSRRVRAGDDVRIRIAESELASKPSRRERADPTLIAKAEEKYLEKAAARLGWKIIKPKKSPSRE